MEDISPIQTEEQQVLATWQAPILPRHERSKRWYAIGGTAVVACAAYGIVTGSWTLTVVSLLCGAMYYLVRDHVPPLKTVVITDKGVLLEEKFTRWEDVSGFWILNTPEYSELHFVPKLARRSDILIQTGDRNLEDLRIAIGSHIPEFTDKRESFLDALIRTAKL